MKKNNLAKKLLRKKAAHPLMEMIPKLEEWFDTPAGKELFSKEEKIMEEVLSTLFGYHLMQIGVNRKSTLYKSSKIGHRFSIGPIEGGEIVAIAHEEQLAIATESVDVVILHHTMEYTQHPHFLLNEVSRIVVPSGYIIIVGFNPFSFIGLWSLLGRWFQRSIWNNRLFTISRIADWLELMGFSINNVHYGFYKPPINHEFMHHRVVKRIYKLGSLLNYFQLPFGGFYILVAKKELPRLTPIKLKWQLSSKSMIPIMEPSLYTPGVKTSSENNLKSDMTSSDE